MAKSIGSSGRLGSYSGTAYKRTVSKMVSSVPASLGGGFQTGGKRYATITAARSAAGRSLRIETQSRDAKNAQSEKRAASKNSKRQGKIDTRMKLYFDAQDMNSRKF